MEIIAENYLELKDWKMVEHAVLEDNLLGKGTIATRKREFKELQKRLKTLTHDQLKYYRNGSGTEIKQLSLLACFKLYDFMYEFTTEVIRNKLLLFDYQVLNSDYESFYESKALSHDNLNTISESTQKKLKQVLFKILEQSELIDSVKNKNIQKPYLSEDLIKLIIQDDPKYLSAFLYSDNEINDYIQRFK